jgi:hypothetical protein
MRIFIAHLATTIGAIKAIFEIAINQKLAISASQGCGLTGSEPVLF